MSINCLVPSKTLAPNFGDLTPTFSFSSPTFAPSRAAATAPQMSSNISSLGKQKTKRGCGHKLFLHEGFGLFI